MDRIGWVYMYMYIYTAYCACADVDTAYWPIRLMPAEEGGGSHGYHESSVLSQHGRLRVVIVCSHLPFAWFSMVH